MGVGRIVEVGSRARRADCRLGGGWASGMGVGRIVEFDSRARIAGCR
jgi:hypothetical protein